MVDGSSRLGEFSGREWAALSVPFLIFHLLLYGMLFALVPGFWSAFPLLVVGSVVLAVYALVMPIRTTRRAHVRGVGKARTWLIAQAVTLLCWLSGFVVWSVLKIPVPDGP